MYLSFLQDEIDDIDQKIQDLQAQSQRLQDIGDEFESKASDIAQQLSETMRDAVSDAIAELFEEHGIDDNYYNEKGQEVEDNMVDQITSEFGM